MKVFIREPKENKITDMIEKNELNAKVMYEINPVGTRSWKKLNDYQAKFE